MNYLTHNLCFCFEKLFFFKVLKVIKFVINDLNNKEIVINK